MLKLKKILTEIDLMRLSSITETLTGCHLSSDEFKEEIKNKVVKYTDYNLVPGHCIFLLKNNSIDFFSDFFAFFLMDITVVPIDATIHSAELNNMTQHAKPALVLGKSNVDHIDQVPSEELQNIAIILFTSGTTSIPKGVLISKNALLKKIELLSKVIPADEVSNSLCFLPTHFGHGLICNSLFPLMKGQNFFISPKMDLEFAANFNEFLIKNDINFFSSVPSHWEMIFIFNKAFKGAKLKRVHCASAPLTLERAKNVLAWLGEVAFYDVYGATEMLGWFADKKINRPEDSGKFSQFWDLEYVMSSENELLVRSAYMFNGYWIDGKRTNIDFFNTGDIFKNDRLVGRSKNVIIKNGIKIYTDELNEEILKSGLVSDVATFPIEDKFTGERIIAIVVLNQNATVEKLKAYCRINMSAFRLPAEYLTVESITSSSRGKRSLSDLRKLYLEICNE